MRRARKSRACKRRIDFDSAQPKVFQMLSFFVALHYAARSNEKKESKSIIIDSGMMTTVGQSDDLGGPVLERETVLDYCSDH